MCEGERRLPFKSIFWWTFRGGYRLILILKSLREGDWSHRGAPGFLARTRVTVGPWGETTGVWSRHQEDLAEQKYQRNTFSIESVPDIPVAIGIEFKGSGGSFALPMIHCTKTFPKSRLFFFNFRYWLKSSYTLISPVLQNKNSWKQKKHLFVTWMENFSQISDWEGMLMKVLSG